jgi:chemotaxis protein methyltransferase CheR
VIAAEQLDHAEVEATLEAVRRASGIDFRRYASTTVLRRLREIAVCEGGLPAARARALGDPAAMDRLVASLCVSVTALFRDPEFHRAFRDRAVPLLRGRPTVRLWHPGCATGEEVFSMAILLHEAGLYERSRLYGTDVHDAALQQARAGVLPLHLMREYTHNYHRAGGRGEFSAYYVADDHAAILRGGLRTHLHFARHDLARDAAFAEFDAIVCRNVLIYFDDGLKERAHRLFLDSLGEGAVLALGHAEELPHAFRDAYEEVDGRERIYRRLPAPSPGER